MTVARHSLLPGQTWPTTLAGHATALLKTLRIRPGRSRRTLATLLVRLAQQRQALARLSADTEVTFLAMGEALQAQAEAGGNLVALGRRLVAFHGSDTPEPDVNGAALELIRQTLGFVDECAEHARELVLRLDDYHARTGLLLKAEEEVERILAPLRIIQTLLRIESVLLPSEMQAGFTALSGEIPKFEAEVRQTVGQHAGKLAQTRQAIEATTTRLRERAAMQDAAAVAERTRITETLAGLERELAHGRERNTRLNQLIGGIDREISTLVVSLQYQDITRQKMEHIGTALDEIQQRLDPARPTTPDPTLSGLHASCRLEARQATAVREELDKALGAVTTGASGILEQLRLIETDCWPRNEFQTVAGAVTERVATLHAILRDLRELLPAALANADEAVGIIDGFDDVAANVATTAREMAEGMRLIALNAQVLAAQAGNRGAGLLVLAEQTYRISDDIRLVTEKIGAELAGANGQLEAVVKQCETLKLHARERGREFDERGGVIESRLRVHRDETVQALEQVGALLEKINGQTVAMQATARTGTGYCTVLTGLHDQLEAVAAMCLPDPGSRPPPEQVAAQLSQLEQRYTMESERAVHAAVVTGRPPAAARELVPTPGANQAAAPEFGHNVDLF